jgi:hypothetical protein
VDRVAGIGFWSCALELGHGRRDTLSAQGRRIPTVRMGREELAGRRFGFVEPSAANAAQQRECRGMGKIGPVLQAVTVELVVLDQLVADQWRAESRRCFHRHCGANHFDRLNYRGIAGQLKVVHSRAPERA